MATKTIQRVLPGAIAAAVSTQQRKAVSSKIVSRILDRTPGLFGKKGKAFEKIHNRLGWTDVVRFMAPKIPQIEKLVQYVKDSGLEHVVILGMGGSSLCPEVFGSVFGRQSWLKSFTIVDTTAPSQINQVLSTIDLTKSFFIVASKSGSTIETVSQFRFFFKLVKDKRPLKAGQYFAAVTDEYSELHRMARRNRFVETFCNPEDIGGRYSALSFFGLVPGAFTKMKLGKVLGEAESFLRQMEENPSDNDALELGVLMGAAALKGRDKLRFVASNKTAPFIPWIEQLVAESTGKDGKGIIPVEGDFRGVESDTLNDGLFVYYSMGDKVPAPIKRSTHTPQIEIKIGEPAKLGAEMLKWEMATAVASSLMGVNPFDEPNVTESKKNTSKLLIGPRGPRKIVKLEPRCSIGDVDIMMAEGIPGLNAKRKFSADEVMGQFFRGVKPGDYVALLNYTSMLPNVERQLVPIRQAIAKKYNTTVLRGYGPRYLHSIGQLYKGGAPKGHFIVFEQEYEIDYEVPMMRITFERLIRAQAKGDIQALRKRRRPVVTVNLKSNPARGLKHFGEVIHRS